MENPILKNSLVYICSPYRGNLFQRFRNIRYARQLTRNAIRLGFAPITTHLYLTQVLNDERPTERKEGLTAGLNILSECGMLIVGTRYGISKGMETEIEWAQLSGIKISWILSEIETGGKAHIQEPQTIPVMPCIDWAAETKRNFTDRIPKQRREEGGQIKENKRLQRKECYYNESIGAAYGKKDCI